MTSIRAARVTKSRWASRPLTGQSASMPPHDHPALMNGHTIVVICMWTAPLM
jgi:hypothetical protein